MDDGFLSELGCTVQLVSTEEYYPWMGNGAFLRLRMLQPGDGRNAEVYLSPKNVGELQALLESYQRTRRPQAVAGRFFRRRFRTAEVRFLAFAERLILR